SFIEPVVDHYFRHLCQILKYVDSKRDISHQDYIEILAAQLSNNELIVIFYYSIIIGDEKMKKLLTKYNIIANLLEGSDIFCKLTYEYYPNTKFRFNVK